MTSSAKGAFLATISMAAALVLAPAGALAIEVIFSSPNTTVTLGVPYGQLELNNPLSGSESVAGFDVLEWRDAGFFCSGVPVYEDWTPTPACTSCGSPGGCTSSCVPGGCPEGYDNEIWLRFDAQSATTTTTTPASALSIHLHGDDNDGIAHVWVDGVLAATVDMYTATSDNALIIVSDLPMTTHTIIVEDGGPSQQPGTGSFDDDLAILGAAALGGCTLPAVSLSNSTLSTSGITLICPSGDTEPSTTEIWVRDAMGNPVPDYPASQIWMQFADGSGVAMCDEGRAYADGPTDANGFTTISTTPAAGGEVSNATLEFYLGCELWTTFANGLTKSADMNGDGVFNICDTYIFSEDFEGTGVAGVFVSDLDQDGTSDFDDGVIFARHSCHACSDPVPLATVAEIGIYFDAAGTVNTNQVAAGEWFDMYIVVRNVPQQIMAIDVAHSDIVSSSPNMVVVPGALLNGGQLLFDHSIGYYGTCLSAGSPVAIARVQGILSAPDTDIVVSITPTVCGPPVTPTYADCGSCEERRFTTITNAVLNAATPVLPVPAARDNYVLHDAVPNPFNPSTSIRFEIFRDEAVSLDILELGGRRIRRLLDSSFMTAGDYAITWDGRDDAGVRVASGVYHYCLRSSGGVSTKAVTLLK